MSLSSHADLTTTPNTGMKGVLMARAKTELIPKTYMIERGQDRVIKKLCAEQKWRSDSQALRHLIDLGIAKQKEGSE